MSLLSQLTAPELIPIITILIIIMRCIKLVLVVNVYIIHVDAYIHWTPPVVRVRGHTYISCPLSFAQ